MSTLAEIEAAADALPAEEKQELLLFLGTRLRTQAGELPPLCKFGREQIQAWIENAVLFRALLTKFNSSAGKPLALPVEDIGYFSFRRAVLGPECS